MWRFFCASIKLANYLHIALRAELSQLKRWIAGNTNWIVGIIACAIAFAFSVLMRFHSVNVDITFLQEHASKIEWLEPSTYFSGFHPILLPLLIKLSGIEQWPLIGLLLSNALYGLCSTLLFTILKKQLKQQALPLVITLTISSLPQFFEVFVSPMQDSFLVFWILMSTRSFQRKSLLSSGMYMGFAALTRGHGIYIALLFFLFFVFYQHRSFKDWRKWLLGILLIYSPQLLVNLSATGIPFESYQNFNIYQHFYLGQFPSSANLLLPSSILGIIQADPQHFESTYFLLLKKNALWLFMAGLGLLVGILRRNKILTASGTLLLAYLLLAIMGNSSRLYAPVILFLGFVLMELADLIRFQKGMLQWIGLLVLLGLLHLSWMDNASLLLKYRHSQRITQSFSAEMLSDLPHIERKQVFNAHFEYTWEGIPGFAGRARATNWYRYQNPEYNTDFDVPSLEDPPSAFHASCKKLGIEYLILRQGLLVPDAFDRWASYTGFEIRKSFAQKKFTMSSHYEALSKDIDSVHLIKVMP